MGQQINSVINLVGGLDLVSTHYMNQAAPGTARTMVNMEASINAGYRRINGWEQFGSATPTGSADRILGVYPYADGVIAVASTGIYFSTDGDTWVQVNRDTYVAQTGTVEVTNTSGTYIDVVGTTTSFTTEYEVGDHIRIDGNIRQIAAIASNTSLTLETEISGGVVAGTAHYKNGQTTLTASAGATVKARTDQGRAQFAWYPNDGEYGSLVITDEAGANNLAYIKISDLPGTRTYYYDVLDSDFAAPTKPKYICQFQERIVVANDDDNVGRISWSERLSNQRFDGASAGTAILDAPILAVKPLRDRVIIFTRNAIHQLVELDDPQQLNTAILPVAYNVGCASGWSVQEIGGDLIFLAHDGIRTLKASDSYGDVQFGNVARKIDPIIKLILADIDNLVISSSVFRLKNQYRLFYTKSTNTTGEQLGLCGTLKPDLQGQVVWQWSQIQGVNMACLESIANTFLTTADVEKHFHGQYDGKVCLHDVGNDFGGSEIEAQLELNEIDYGDIGRRKTLHYVRLFGDVEEATVDDIYMQVLYDYADPDTHQPGQYIINDISGISTYGKGIYDTSVFGSSGDFNKRVLVEGSGFSNKFTFNSRGISGPFSLNSLYVDMRVGPQL